METGYFASLEPPAVYRVDGFGMLEEVYEAVPDTPEWRRRTTLEAGAVRSGSVPITELDTTVILGAWAQRLEHRPTADDGPETSTGPTVVATSPMPSTVAAPAAGSETIRLEHPVWVEPDPVRAEAQEAQIQLSRHEALSAFRELSGGASSASSGRGGLTWL